MNNDAFQAPSLEELAPLFPNYSIDAFIAQGGMGAVYLGTQTSLERQVAIKILPREFGADPEFRKSFAAEAKAMAKLNHPNLIGVYDFGEVDGMPFIVMEYVAGKPLHDSAYGKQIDPNEAARIVMETCHGLHHAHEHNILHRDVKPANILMDPRHAEPKLGDFGLAMAATDDSDDGLIYGTPGYAAPEVYEGNPDARSDVYAAAVILYQLLTGQMPDNPYQHPSAFVNCDRRFDALLAKALQPDPADRHQTAAELADELESIQKSPATAVVATSHATPHRPAAPLASSKKNSHAPMIGALAALLVLGGGFFLLKSNKTADESTEAPPDTAEFSPHKDPETVLETPSKEEPSSVEVEPAPTEEPEQEMVEVVVEEEEEEPVEVVVVEEEPDTMEEEIDPVVPATPSTPAAPVSTFDHLAFLKRGRDYCVNNGSKIIAQYHEDLIKNIDSLERKGKAILRDQEYLARDDERARRENLETAVEKYRQEGLLPTTLVSATPEAFTALSYYSSGQMIEKTLREALADQAEIGTKMEEDLKPLAEIYAKGVEKQAQTLKSEGNDHDAAILLKEAKQAQDSIPYFLEIVRGENPLPKGLNNDPAHMSLEELLVGYWQSESNRTTFTFHENGTSTGLNPKQRGSWRVEGEQIIADWGAHQDLITMVPQEHDRFLANFRGKGKLVYFSRVDEDLSYEQPEQKPEDSPIKENLTGGSAPIVGDWLGKERRKKATYRFEEDGTVLRVEGKKQGTWKAEEENLYLVKWENGMTTKLKIQDADTLDVNDGAYTLSRQQDPLVGQWALVSKGDNEVIFTFKSDHHADNGSWSRNGKWAKTEDAYRITWNNGKWLDLTFDGDNAIDVIDSRGTKRRLTRK